MRKKKVVKIKKVKKTTRKTKMNPAAVIEQMEKSFKTMPNQLAANYRKEVIVLKTQEKKLSDAWKKADALARTIQAKCDDLSNANPTPRAKKQLKAAKLGWQKANKAAGEMSKQLNSIQALTAALADKQAKFTMLGKELAKWEKEWSAKPKAVVPPKAKRKAKVAVDPSVTETIEIHPEMTHDMEPETAEMN
jgi:hypothetical protein